MGLRHVDIKFWHSLTCETSTGVGDLRTPCDDCSMFVIFPGYEKKTWYMYVGRVQASFGVAIPTSGPHHAVGKSLKLFGTMV